MYVTLVHVHVKQSHVSDFITATEINHRASIQETGNRRFDILQSPQDSSRFTLYEAYIDEAAAKQHKETAHYLTWRKTVAEWMASPRQGEPLIGLFPKG
ncbi:Antibiotic biosynthesis monooxygenase [hydrothermal vent metagenome]|uniref:Antibiotic biosynthesis monooxygenase n=1 Tax=hydrothermal vent metagenome TaxID=652676 RepID=A0A3B0ZCH9_9ZZZZ